MTSSLSGYASALCSDVQVTAPDSTHGRRLIAKRAFQPGDLIFTEQAVLHTSNPISQSFTPSPDSEIPSDWQHLLHLYAHLRSTLTVQLAVRELSTEGVTSPAAQAADPERAVEYRAWAEEWAASAHPPISAAEADKLLSILETNTHTRNEIEQYDLNDPLLPIAPTKYRGKLVSLDPDVDVDMEDDEYGDDDEGEDEDEDEDEATGLWILASLANHSCLPTCVAHIPASAPPPSAMPPLHLRCIRPIAPGGELTITYHSEEHMLRADRQHQLASRGFACTCALCAGAAPEHARGALCARCADGAGVPRGEVWACDACGAPLDAAAVDATEEAWMGFWPAMLLALDSGAVDASMHLPPFALLRALAALPAFLPDADVLRVANAVVGPLHAIHAHVYSFLKYMLFERSFVLRSEFNAKRSEPEFSVNGNDRGDSAIWGVLRCMEAVVERAGMGAESEERRAVGFWVAKEAKRMLEETGVEGWRAVMERGYARWEEGMRILYGRESPK